MNGIFKIGMLAMTGVSAALVIKQWKTDFLPLLRLALSLLFALTALTTASPLIGYLRDLTQNSGFADLTQILWKALGIAILTHCCCGICKDCGETGIAEGVELCGKTELLLLSLPLINEILSVAQELLRLCEN